MNKNINIQQQSGMALITALFILVILTMLALFSMNTTIMDERMAGNSQEKTRAFRAAEIGIEAALNDPDAFSIVKTASNTLKNLDDLGTTASYKSKYIGKSKPPRSSFWDSSFSCYQFKLSATATTSSGVSTKITQGTCQVAKKD